MISQLLYQLSKNNMPKFSKTSLERLQSCAEDLQCLFQHVIAHYDCSIICGKRSKAEQDSAYNKGYSKLKYPLSKHNSNFSRAVDVAPYPIDWKDIKRFYYFGGFVKGMAADLLDAGMIRHEIIWGGDWDNDNDLSDQTFNDLVHFELGKSSGCRYTGI